MEGVLPIRGVDADTGEVVDIPAAGLRKAEDPYRLDVVRWAALDVPSIMVAEDMNLLRNAYKVPYDIELLQPDPNERAYFLRMGCTALSLNAFVSGMRLSLHPFFRRILRAYGLAPTRLFSNGWGQMNALPRCELSREVVDVLQCIYQAPSATRRYEFILNRHRCLIELGLMTMDKEKRPRPALARLSKQKPRALAAGSSEEVHQKNVLEDLSRQGNKEAVEASKVNEVDDSSAPEGERTLAVNTSGEVVLDDPPRLSQKPGGAEGGPYESKRRLRELIGAPGARIPDDVLRNVPFYASMGAQAVKKYFTPKWEEFSSHGDLEDVLETSLATAIRASAMQIKVLGEFRTRMQEQRWLSVAASKSDKEHKQALERLHAALDSARMAYEQLEADLK
ncbi:putative abhydrolase domain-containing protein [Abeliophyllum distichum]|uniref:Abhydrolase domain-containing protein n=1 Tax=Abeliophyllum distichum TaxID=126358 RepID=A0ABD1V4A2_9LAMI